MTFTPTAFLERLAVLVPRPHVNLLLDHGVLAPRASWRSEVVERGASGTGLDPPVDTSAASETSRLAARGASWADLMRRAFEVDVLACPRCGGRLRVIALIEASAPARRILTRLALPAAVPVPARAPPIHSQFRL